MLKFVTTAADGKKDLWLGLTADNLQRLPEEPVLIDLAELGHVHPDRVVLVAGPDHVTLTKRLQALGFPLPDWPEPQPGERREARDLT